MVTSPIGYKSRRACGYFYAFCIYKLNYYFEEILQQHLQLRGLFYTGLSIKASYTRASLLGHQGDFGNVSNQLGMLMGLRPHLRIQLLGDPATSTAIEDRQPTTRRPYQEVSPYSTKDRQLRGDPAAASPTYEASSTQVSLYRPFIIRPLLPSLLKRLVTGSSGA